MTRHTGGAAKGRLDRLGHYLKIKASDNIQARVYRVLTLVHCIASALAYACRATYHLKHTSLKRTKRKPVIQHSDCTTAPATFQALSNSNWHGDMPHCVGVDAYGQTSRLPKVSGCQAVLPGECRSPPGQQVVHGRHRNTCNQSRLEVSQSVSHSSSATRSVHNQSQNCHVQQCHPLAPSLQPDV